MAALRGSESLCVARSRIDAALAPCLQRKGTKKWHRFCWLKFTSMGHACLPVRDVGKTFHVAMRSAGCVPWGWRRSAPGLFFFTFAAGWVPWGWRRSAPGLFSFTYAAECGNAENSRAWPSPARGHIQCCATHQLELERSASARSEGCPLASKRRSPELDSFA